MILSKYHQKYTIYSEKEIQQRANEKEAELKEIFKSLSLNTSDKKNKLAVMGCGDRRFVKHHQKIFQKFLKKPVEVTTLDITTEHLKGEQNIIQHDCTMPLPGGPYDITYAHIILKFIETEKQLDLIQNSYDVLKPGGIAIHILNEEDYSTNTLRLPDNYFSVPLEKYKNKLKEKNINYQEIVVKYGMAFVLIK